VGIANKRIRSLHGLAYQTVPPNVSSLLRFDGGYRPIEVQRLSRTAPVVARRAPGVLERSNAAGKLLYWLRGSGSFGDPPESVGT